MRVGVDDGLSSSHPQLAVRGAQHFDVAHSSTHNGVGRG
jgi:hypothetical protein